MNSMLQKLINQGFMTKKEADHLIDAIKCGNNIIISGHRGHGILPLLASLGTTAKEFYNIKHVRNIDIDLQDKNADIFLIGDLKNVNYSEALTKAFSIKGKFIITIKDAEHSFSVMKILTDVFKITGDDSKIYQLAECAKVDNISKLKKLIKITLDEKGRPIKTTFEC